MIASVAASRYHGRSEDLARPRGLPLSVERLDSRTGYRQQRLDCWADLIGYGRRGAGIELAVQEQECKPVDERPDRGGQRLGVSLRKASADALTNVQRYGCGGGDALIVVPIARLPEHDSEEGGPLERELHVGDRHASQLLRGGRRGVRARQPLGELAIADGRHH